jgi:antitoxin component YwqK of YwqJK toxin-antitoxin module
MKYKFIGLIIGLIISTCIYGQKLSLTDLINLCSKKNWEDVNQTLLAKDWTYYDSEKGNTNKYNTITWSFNKEYYSDKAQGWFYLYTYEGFPNKISYSVFNKQSYSLIQNSLSTAGFKLINSEIEDNEVVSTYGNVSYTLMVSTEKRTDDDWSDRSTTAYQITLIKKAGVYDEDNGKKTEYYYDDVVKMEYTLSNGKLHGPFKMYYENGNLKMTGSYLNGVEHGNFVDYDEYGIKEADYVQSNGKVNGVAKVYENGMLAYSNTFKNGIKNGQHITYYNNGDGSCNFKLVGGYLNGEKNGTWKLLYLGDSKERVLKIENYNNGIKNGAFLDVEGDSIIVGTYKNDEIDGKYRVYTDLNRLVFGGVINTDTAKAKLRSEGYFFAGLKSGYWKNYDVSGTLRSEGRFLNNEETGEWKYYHAEWSDLPYSKQLLLVENYANGKLDGKSTRYSYLTKEEYPCSEKDENSLDTCTRFVYEKVFEVSFYKNGMLNGPFESRDSLNNIVTKGDFRNDSREGEWLHRYSMKNENDSTYYIYQKGNYQNNKEEGKWIEYYKEGEISITSHYQNGKLHGEYIDWNSFGKPREIKQFDNGKFRELITYDSLGVKKIKKYEISEKGFTGYKIKETQFLNNSYIVQEYQLQKDKQIDHNWFELMFLIAIDRKMSGEAKGFKDGFYGIYDSEDKPLVTGKYYKEERIDLWTFYYYDHGIKIESHYKNDKSTDEKYLKLNGELFSGEFTFVDNENGIEEIRKVKDGLRNGKTIYKDLKTDKTIKKESYQKGVLK